MRRSRSRSLVVGAILMVAMLATTPVWAGFAGTDVFVASVGHGSGQGGSQWRTTLWINNPGGTAANCQVQLLLRNQANTSPPTYNVTVQPGDTLKFDDATWTLFGIQGYGALRVLSNHQVVVNSRIYNQPGSDISATQGQFFSAIPATFAVSSGESTDVLGVNQAPDNAFRYNYGFVETTGNSVTFQATLYDGDGSTLGARAYSLQPFEAIQVGLADLGAGATPTENGRLHIAVTGGVGRVIAFGSGIANTSQDPSTFEMTLQTQTSASGLTEVAHDPTLIGNGTASSPLGLANAAVTASKLAAGTPTAGKVLKYNGSLVWADDEQGGFSLPFAGSTSTSGTAFSITNATTGTTIAAKQGTGSGYSATGPVFATPALWAESSGAYAVVASSSHSYAGGLAGFSLASNGRAVAAYAEGDNSSAIFAVAAPGTEGTRAGYFQGDVRVTGTLDVEALQVSGHADATVPIAYGMVRANGSLASGSSNVHPSWSGSRYEIAIDGVNYYYTNYTTVVTGAAGGTPYVFTTNSVSGHLLVYRSNLSGTLGQTDFSFVVFANP